MGRPDSLRTSLDRTAQLLSETGLEPGLDNETSYPDEGNPPLPAGQTRPDKLMPKAAPAPSGRSNPAIKSAFSSHFA